MSRPFHKSFCIGTYLGKRLVRADCSYDDRMIVVGRDLSSDTESLCPLEERSPQALGLAELVGKTVTGVMYTYTNESLTFFTDGGVYRQHHKTARGEEVYLESSSGDFSDLLDQKVALVWEVGRVRGEKDPADYGFTYTRATFQIGTCIRGRGVYMCWHGHSDGFSSEEPELYGYVPTHPKYPWGRG